MLSRDRYAVTILFVTPNPAYVNASPHSTKADVCFRNPWLVHVLVGGAIRQALANVGIEPEKTGTYAMMSVFRTEWPSYGYPGSSAIHHGYNAEFCAPLLAGLGVTFILRLRRATNLPAAVCLHPTTMLCTHRSRRSTPASVEAMQASFDAESLLRCRVAA